MHSKLDINPYSTVLVILVLTPCLFSLGIPENTWYEATVMQATNQDVVVMI